MKQLFGCAVLIALMLITAGYATADLADGLVVYFTFDNVKGKTIVDDSGNGLDADIIANTDIVDGKYGKAIRITAVGADCVNVPASDDLKITGEITMAAWINQDSWATDAQWFDKNCHNGGEHSSYGIGAFNGGKNFNMFLGTGNSRPTLSQPHGLDTKKWHHVVGTYDGDTMRVYVDGELAAEKAEKFDFKGTNDQDLRIGCSKDRPNYTFENGSIDEAAVWSRALSEDEIQAIASEGFLSVSPRDKVATTWGSVKRRIGVY
ncbi:LamG domain-containing protein [Candidatus Poribacteria bacterium]|nr:LamG domain-containing protein [Candidatus Poribacteria bacterium]